jgi:hypothetical protein
MPNNLDLTRGVADSFRLDRGGMPTWQGLFLGVVKNNVDPTRSGALEVYIQQLGGPDENDPSTWRKVNYCTPFYGITQQTKAPASGAGNFFNPQSYGMWFTPPDIGVQVICFFVGGDPTKGFYMGCVADPGFNHMVPAIGSSSNYVVNNPSQNAYFARSGRLPVTEINEKNSGVVNNPNYVNVPKPVHSVQAGILFQQGLVNDTERGSISSNAQRESPSTVYGISTPGRPVYAGGLTDQQVQEQLAQNTLDPTKTAIVGRKGGHSLVMDDGSVTGENNLVRIRTSKGHQIMLNDSDNFLYICHSNGQTWIELGQEGTVDVFSTNSINLRSQGDINIHADQDIKMYAGRNFHAYANTEVKLNSSGISQFTSKGRMTVATTGDLGLLATKSVSIKGDKGYFGVAGKLGLTGSKVLLNSGGGIPIPPPVPIVKTLLDDVAFKGTSGWEITKDALTSICSRVPCHEPWPYHNLGVAIQGKQVAFEPGTPAIPPDTQPIPAGWAITVVT